MTNRPRRPSDPRVVAKFLELDSLLQELTNATGGIEMLMVTVTLIANGEVVGRPMTKEYRPRTPAPAEMRT